MADARFPGLRWHLPAVVSDTPIDRSNDPLPGCQVETARGGALDAQMRQRRLRVRFRAAWMAPTHAHTTSASRWHSADTQLGVPSFECGDYRQLCIRWFAGTSGGYGRCLYDCASESASCDYTTVLTGNRRPTECLMPNYRDAPIAPLKSPSDPPARHGREPHPR